MAAPSDITKIRELTNAVHAAAQAAQVTGEPPDVPALLDVVSDALRHVLVVLEDLDRRVSRIDAERRYLLR